MDLALATNDQTMFEQGLQRRQTCSGTHQDHWTHALAPVDMSERPFEQQMVADLQPGQYSVGETASKSPADVQLNRAVYPTGARHREAASLTVREHDAQVLPRPIAKPRTRCRSHHKTGDIGGKPIHSQYGGLKSIRGATRGSRFFSCPKLSHIHARQ
jgi:hypothetical protein